MRLSPLLPVNTWDEFWFVYLKMQEILEAFKRLKKTFLFLILLSVSLSLFTAFKAHMNNWLIFRAAFDHLIDRTSLYVLYPEEHHDLFKYSPTFAMLMAPLAILPHWLGATLWNLLGALLFIFALIKLPLTDSQRQGVFWISLPEFIGSTQGFQSNIHLVSLLMLFWVYLENGQTLKSSLSVLCSFFIKVFGIIAGSLFVFSHYSWRRPRFLFKNIFMLLTVALFLTFLPILVVGWDSLVFQYQEWLRLLKMDAAQSHGFSLMGVVYSLTGLPFSNLPFQIFGAISLLGTFAAFRNSPQSGRLLGLIAICYFMVVFNHKSESPTFIIAMMAFGIHVTFFTNKKIRWFLIILTLTCVSVLYSDLFKAYKQSVFDVYAVKVWPFLLLYPLCLIQIGLTSNRQKKPSLNTEPQSL